MSERPFMQLYVSDFIGDTLHLSTEQIGAYMLMLMAMWNAGGSLPDDDAKVARVVRMSVKKWRAISDDLMVYFDRSEGLITHNRLTKELQKSERKSQSRASAGAKGGAAKALKNNNQVVANAKQLPKHSPDTREKELPNGSSKKPTPRDELSSVLDVEHAEAVLAHRQKLRKPLTVRAASLLAKKLGQCPDANAAADLMIERGWQAIEPDWVRNASQPNGTDPPKRDLTDDDWRKRIGYWRRSGEWVSGWGPKPGTEGCKAPQHLLDEHKEAQTWQAESVEAV